MAPRHIYIGSAWPYPNGSLHLGHIAALLPGDVLARYFRLNGDNVLWTSGSDTHGTPITERARREGVTPRQIAERFHTEFAGNFARLGFSYDLYWATYEPPHYERTQASFLELFEKGLIAEGDYFLTHCPTCGQNRADREVMGKCFLCHAERARGDQCDICGETLTPDQLLNPICSVCGQAGLKFTKSRELFLELPKMEEQLRDWVAKQTHWRDNAKKWTDDWLKRGLKRRCITRELEWGVPVPLPGWEHRRIYVWFDAFHGYLNASMEWALQRGEPDAWKPFWTSDALAYYPIGKDNIPFHTLWWPGILMARGLALPHHIVSSEFLGLEGRKLSTSQNWALWVPDFLARHPDKVDQLRYFLVAKGPETRDTDFTWASFVQHTDGELAANWSNLVHRVFSFAARLCGGKMPAPMAACDEQDRRVLGSIEGLFNEVGGLIENTEFRAAIDRVMGFVQELNQYISRRKPWEEQRTSRNRAETTAYVALMAIAALAVLTEPFMPFQAERLRVMFGGGFENRRWEPPAVAPGTPFGDIRPLFTKLDPLLAEREIALLKAQETPSV